MTDNITLDAVIRLCQQAGDAILGIYHSGESLHVDHKADDSPLTQADLASHKILESGLSPLLGGLPVLSEEGQQPHVHERCQWARYWLVDPLDGTKEFIQRNGEFTVNVALIENDEPVLGVVYAPAQGITYSGVKGQGAHKHQGGTRQVIRTRSAAQRIDQRQPLTVLTSRRHGLNELTPLLERLTQQIAPITTQAAGSSLKLCLIAEGAADFFPRLGPTCEWDTAAAQAIVEAAGGSVVYIEKADHQLKRLHYNQRDTLLNPSFYAYGDPNINWVSVLAP